MKVIHSWLREYVGESLPDAKKVDDLLTFHAFEVDGIEEVIGESVIDVDILPNRSSDCLSHRGIARELASILDTPLVKDPLNEPVDLPAGTKISLNIEDGQLCNRFTAAVITGVKVKESPDWLKKRIEVLGQRSINNVVDATNYVMFAIGQPTHAFDYDKLAQDTGGKVNITIRNGKEGESLTLLTGEEISSDETVLHLVDGNSDILLDLAGIKGGAAAELTDDTVNIVVTSGNFNYQSVRKTSRKLKVFTDAAQRFQNEPSAELAGYGLAETVKLILEVAAGECDGMVDEYSFKPEEVKTTVKLEAINSLLGLQLTEEEVKGYLTRVAKSVSEVDGGFEVVSLWERTDLSIEEDYIEEVGRMHGLMNIESVQLDPIPVKEINQRQFYGEKVRQQLIELGFSEVITSSFQKKGKLQLRNALASDKSYLRENLTKNITATLDKNYSHIDLLGVSDVRVFEIGTVFSKTDTNVTEHVSVAFGVRKKGNGYSPKDDKPLTEAKEALDSLLGTKVDWVSDKGVAECNLSELLETLPKVDGYTSFEKQESTMYAPVSAFPAIARDIALWVEEGVAGDDVKAVLSEYAGTLCVRCDAFDTFTKDGRTSYAFRLVFLSHERTLTDGEINTVMECINSAVKEKGWEVR